MIDFLLGPDPVAAELLSRFIFKATHTHTHIHPAARARVRGPQRRGRCG